MKKIAVLIIAVFFLHMNAAQAGPMPVGTGTMPLQGGLMQQPNGLPPVWHVRGGTAFPVRDHHAEAAMLGRIYLPKLSRKREVQGTLVRSSF